MPFLGRSISWLSWLSCSCPCWCYNRKWRWCSLCGARFIWDSIYNVSRGFFSSPTVWDMMYLPMIWWIDKPCLRQCAKLDLKIRSKIEDRGQKIFFLNVLEVYHFKNIRQIYFKIIWTLANLSEHMHKKFEVNWTKIIGGCQSRRQVAEQHS